MWNTETKPGKCLEKHEFSPKNTMNFDCFSFGTQALTTEDCTYLLRSLEIDAFSSILSALRSQGPLTDYKYHLLRHIKAALFISDDRWKGELRRATNDDNLTYVAEKLNPNYDVYSSWAKEGASVTGKSEALGDDFSFFDLINKHDDEVKTEVINEAKNEAKTEAMKLADELLLLAEGHNNRLANPRQMLLDLIALPKKPYVPEKLRNLLKLSEMDSDGICLVKSPKKKTNNENNNNKKKLLGHSQNRGNLAASNAGQCKIASSKSVQSVKSMEVLKNAAGECKSLPTVLNATEMSETLSRGMARQTPSVSDKWTKYSNTTCARTRPFVFAPIDPITKNKQFRGNPDRRTGKRDHAGSPTYSSMQTEQSSPVDRSSINSPVEKLTKRQRTVSANAIIPAKVVYSQQQKMLPSYDSMNSKINRSSVYGQQNRLPLIGPVSSVPVRSSVGPRYVISTGYGRSNLSNIAPMDGTVETPQNASPDSTTVISSAENERKRRSLTYIRKSASRATVAASSTTMASSTGTTIQHRADTASTCAPSSPSFSGCVKSQKLLPEDVRAKNDRGSSREKIDSNNE